MSVLVETSDRALTAEQQEAVGRRTGSLLLAAGAGSGKTSVLVERFVAAVRDDGIAPSRILAITFTERAAGELRSRLRARLAALGERAAVAELERSEIGTVHGFCARLLRAHAPAAGLDPRFAVLDEPRADHLRELAFRESLAQFVGLGGAHARDGAVELLAAYGPDRLRTAVATVHDELRSRGEAAPALPVLHGDDQAALAAWGLFGALLEGYGGAYERLKRARAVVDFDDLELRARDLLRHDASVRAAWSQRLQMLMVDELQDINPRQLELLEALEQDNLFTVGDELQSIYGFRHADVGLFRARRAARAAHGASLALTANFRSAPAVLEVVNAVFGPLLGEAYTPLRAGRGEAAAAGEPVCELLLTDTIGWDGLAAGDVGAGLPPVAAWRAAEARLLAQRLDDLIGSGAARPRDVVVLMRASSDLPAYERALQDRGLPTIAAGAGGYWSGQQVGDLLAYLRTLANPLDELAVYSLLASPLIGVSSDGLALLARAAREAGCDTWSLLAGERLPPLRERDAGRDASLLAGERLPSLRERDAGRDASLLAGERLPSLRERDAGRDASLLAGERLPSLRERDAGRDASLLAGEQLPSLRERDAGRDAWSLLGGEELSALPEPDAERLRAIWPWLVAERAAAARHPASELLVRMLRRTGYEAYLCSLRSGERRLANVHKLLRLARAFEAQEGIDLRAFLDHAARQTQAQAREADAPVDDGDRDAVTLMTIHAAKGLEFPVVAVADLGRRGRNDVPDLLVSARPAPGAGGLRLVGLDGSSAPALEYERLRSERLEAGAAEELRVMYVAMTRARERLILSGAVNVARWPASSPGAPPIGWLAPAVVEGLTELVTDEQPLADGHPPGAPQARVRVSLSSPATFGRVLRELAGPREPEPARDPKPEPELARRAGAPRAGARGWVPNGRNT